MDTATYPRDIGDTERTQHYDLRLMQRSKSSSYRVASEHLREHYASNIDYLIYRDAEKLAVFNEERKIRKLDITTAPSEETFLSVVGDYFVVSAISSYRRFLEGFKIYHHLRTDESASARTAFLTAFERSVAPDGENFMAVLNTLYNSDREFKNDVNLGMGAAFGDPFDELVFLPVADGRVQLRLRWKHLKRDISAAYLSDGTLRFLYLVTILANPNPPSLIAIDEPETGLHPGMFPIIAEFAVDASRRTQVVFTTHSAEFLSSFNRHTAIPTVTVVEAQEGETILRNVSGESLAYWVKEYSLGELFRSGHLEWME